jgi:hypothetical protein
MASASPTRIAVIDSLFAIRQSAGGHCVRHGITRAQFQMLRICSGQREYRARSIVQPSRLDARVVKGLGSSSGLTFVYALTIGCGLANYKPMSKRMIGSTLEPS